MSHALNVLFVSPCGLDLIPPGACKSLNSSVIYANNEVNLAEVDIYGFDYDYTLAQYSNALNTLIYNTARDFLVEHFKVCLTSRIKYGGSLWSFSHSCFVLFALQYPEEIKKYDYLPNFAVRGLHYDIQKVLEFTPKNEVMLIWSLFFNNQTILFAGSSDENRCISLHPARNSVSVRKLMEKNSCFCA